VHRHQGSPTWLRPCMTAPSTGFEWGRYVTSALGLSSSHLKEFKPTTWLIEDCYSDLKFKLNITYSLTSSIHTSASCRTCHLLYVCVREKRKTVCPVLFRQLLVSNITYACCCPGHLYETVHCFYLPTDDSYLIVHSTGIRQSGIGFCLLTTRGSSVLQL
jgi:hypothetical protein